MYRMKVGKHKRGPLPLRYILLMSFVLFILSTSVCLWIVNMGIKPILIDYAEAQTKKIAPLVINKAIKDVMPEIENIHDILDIQTTDQGKLMIKYKTDIMNRAQSDLAYAIAQNLKQAERGDLESLQQEANIEVDYEQSQIGEGIVYFFPIGQVTNNALLGNLGPKIPIRFTALGSVESDMDMKVEQYPINNLAIEVIVKIEVQVQIIIPFGTKQTVVTQEVPIAGGVFPGEVPQFYNENGQTNPSIQLPVFP